MSDLVGNHEDLFSRVAAHRETDQTPKVVSIV